MYLRPATAVRPDIPSCVPGGILATPSWHILTGSANPLLAGRLSPALPLLLPEPSHRQGPASPDVPETLGLIEHGRSQGAGGAFAADRPDTLERSSRSVGSETVLIVEADKTVLAIARRALTAGGYAILDAPDPRGALKAADGSDRPVDLLITDVMMFEMSGMRLADALRRRNPLLKVIFMAGYIDDIALRYKDPLGGVAVVQKPFSPDVLATVVRRMLREES